MNKQSFEAWAESNRRAIEDKNAKHQRHGEAVKKAKQRGELGADGYITYTLRGKQYRELA